MLPRGEITEDLKALDQMSARCVSEDVVDAGRSVAGGVAVPVLLGGEGGRILLWGALGNIVPPFLQHLEKEGAAPYISVGIHAAEVWGPADTRGSPSRLLEKSGAVPPA